jgi:hypothetical protein
MRIIMKTKARTGASVCGSEFCFAAYFRELRPDVRRTRGCGPLMTRPARFELRRAGSSVLLLNYRGYGSFEVAHGSTLFLDEVGELPLIAAANRDLEKAAREKRFYIIG